MIIYYPDHVYQKARELHKKLKARQLKCQDCPAFSENCSCMGQCRDNILNALKNEYEWKWEMEQRFFQN